ncbi:MAG: hypothetical protein ACFFBP_08320 [Promethearchaeota archaeon]
MKKKYTFILITFLITIFFPFSVVSANMPPENLYTNSSAFYVCALNKYDILTLNLTPSDTGSGVFSMYLLNERPLNDNLVSGTIVAEGLNIYYNATNRQIYYIKIHLAENGPDTFQLTVMVNGEFVQLVRYYIPQIPGFPLEFLLLSITIGFGLILYIIRKRKMIIE